MSLALGCRAGKETGRSRAEHQRRVVGVFATEFGAQAEAIVDIESGGKTVTPPVHRNARRAEAWAAGCRVAEEKSVRTWC